jgi:FixJ family two-component response regulator
LDAVRAALDRDRLTGKQEREVADLRRRFDSLTSREQVVISMVVCGMLNKQIPEQLGTAENTVKFIAAGQWRKYTRNRWPTSLE